MTECGCVPGHRMTVVGGYCLDCGQTEMQAAEGTITPCSGPTSPKGGKHIERTYLWGGPYVAPPLEVAAELMRNGDPVIPVDSRAGAQMLMEFARKGGFVLDECHEKLAIKHGVSTDGVMFSRPIP